MELALVNIKIPQKQRERAGLQTEMMSFRRMLSSFLKTNWSSEAWAYTKYIRCKLHIHYSYYVDVHWLTPSSSSMLPSLQSWNKRQRAVVQPELQTRNQSVTQSCCMRNAIGERGGLISRGNQLAVAPEYKPGPGCLQASPWACMQHWPLQHPSSSSAGLPHQLLLMKQEAQSDSCFPRSNVHLCLAQIN